MKNNEISMRSDVQYISLVGLNPFTKVNATNFAFTLGILKTERKCPRDKFLLHLLYQKITDIYATALDYDKTAKTTREFFAKVQNKMQIAVRDN